MTGTKQEDVASVESAAGAPAQEPSTTPAGPSKFDTLLAELSAADDAEAATRREMARGIIGDDATRDGPITRGKATVTEDKVDDEPEAKATEELATTTEEQPATPGKYSAEDQKKALTALRFAKVPEHVTKALDSDSLTEWGLSLREGQVERDHEKNQIADLRKKVEELTRQPAKPEATEAGEQHSALTPSLDLNGITASLSERLGLDDEGKGALGTFAKAVASAAAQSASRATQVATEVQRVRSLLGERFPEMSDESTFQKVYAKADRLAGTGDYASIEAAFSDAARLMLTERKPEVVNGEPENAKRPVAHQVASPPRQRTKPKPLGEDEMWQRRLELAEQGMSPHEIRARLSQ